MYFLFGVHVGGPETKDATVPIDQHAYSDRFVDKTGSISISTQSDTDEVKCQRSMYFIA